MLVYWDVLYSSQLPSIQLQCIPIRPNVLCDDSMGMFVKAAHELLLAEVHPQTAALDG